MQRSEDLATVSPAPMAAAAAADAVVVVVSAPPPEPAALGRDRAVPAAAKVLLYLCLASTWVACAATAAATVARRSLSLDSPVTVALYKTAAGAILFAAVLLLGLLLRVMTVLGVRTVVEETAASVREIGDSSKVLRELIWEMLRDAAGLALLACFLFILLQVAGILVRMGPLPVDRSQRERISDALIDVGVLGYMAMFCFIILPYFAMKLWKIK